MINNCFGQIMLLYISLGAAILSITGYQSLKVSLSLNGVENYAAINSNNNNQSELLTII